MAGNVRREVITREYYPDSGGQPQQGGAPLRKVAAQGQRGDTQLAHVNQWEQALLKKLGGAGTINPKTGLKQFYWDGLTWMPDEIYQPSVGYSSVNSSISPLPSTSSAGYQANLAAANAAYPAAIATPTPTSGGDDSGWDSGESGGGGGENYFDFPTDIMPTQESYSGLPVSYRDSLLKTLMPQLTQSIANMPKDIDKYVAEALAMYEQERANAVRKGIPTALGQLANRGIISSTEGENVLSNVYSDSATAASDKGYQTAMQGALLKANIATVLGEIAKLGQYSSGSSSDPTEMYRIMAQLLAGQF